jgi:hypothetical protein
MEKTHLARDPRVFRKTGQRTQIHRPLAQLVRLALVRVPHHPLTIGRIQHRNKRRVCGAPISRRIFVYGKWKWTHPEGLESTCKTWS